MLKIKNLVLICAILYPILSIANEHAGTLTQSEGKVHLFQNPSKKFSDKAQQVLFEGTYYTIKEAKVGDTVIPGNILRTAPDAKAKVIFENGDQFSVGPGTHYKVEVPANSKLTPKVALSFGKIRAQISKRGPRNKLKITTKSATMGVRGTDFYIKDSLVKGTEVSVLRGKVAVKPDQPKAKEVPIKAGFSAEVPPPPPAPKKEEISATKEVKDDIDKKVEAPIDVKTPEIKIKKTSKQDLVAIQKNSVIKKDLTKEKPLDQETQKTLEKLEKTAVKTTLQDIKEDDPKLYAEIKDKPMDSTSDISTQTVQKLFKEAPVDPEKPFVEDLEDLGDDAYKKYFKVN